MLGLLPVAAQLDPANPAATAIPDRKGFFIGRAHCSSWVLF
jgi:hypothetical protein